MGSGSGFGIRGRVLFGLEGHGFGVECPVISFWGTSICIHSCTCEPLTAEPTTRLGQRHLNLEQLRGISVGAGIMRALEPQAYNGPCSQFVQVSKHVAEPAELVRPLWPQQLSLRGLGFL